MPTGSGNDGIAPRLLRWFDRHGRHDLPWQHPRTPYRVWISEVMLQQTQVATAIPYFERFVRALPDVQALANASEDEVFALWSGLGYYARARNLHRAARACVAHSGELPAEFDALLALPGIGRSTAGAILALSRGERFSILDGNVKRVLARHAGVRGWPGERSVDEELWALTEKNTPHRRIADYTQAIMDLGATVCTRARPRCSECPLSDDCVAFRQGLTAVLPQQRPSRILPERNTVMLILRDARRRVLLQRRGIGGVWSGLWSLPEAEDIAHAARAAAKFARVDASSAQRLQPFLHTFTHYRLHAQPLLWLEVHSAHAVADSDTRWCTQTEFAQLGMPAPVRKLLNAIIHDRRTPQDLRCCD
jgi:A/G-specific adenine glycosylase